MAKIIRPTYPLEFSIGLLLLLFILSMFISFEIFDAKWHAVIEGEGPMIGMLLSGIAVVIMALIVWEEILFPVRIKPTADTIVFRNHFTKLKTQVLIYCIIPVLVVIVYLSYDISYIPFLIWSAICVLTPIGKLISGIKNYNDFLKISDHSISFRNNDKRGEFPLKDIEQIVPVRDESGVLHKIQLRMLHDKIETIDLDEMELEAYLGTIDNFMKGHYGELLKVNTSVL